MIASQKRCRALAERDGPFGRVHGEHFPELPHRSQLSPAHGFGSKLAAQRAEVVSGDQRPRAVRAEVIELIDREMSTAGGASDRGVHDGTWYRRFELSPIKATQSVGTRVPTQS